MVGNYHFTNLEKLHWLGLGKSTATSSSCDILRCTLKSQGVLTVSFFTKSLLKTFKTAKCQLG